MNNAQNPVIGIDVSKRKLDVALLANGKIKAKVVENSAKGHSELMTWLEKQHVSKEEIHACMESTGVYSEPVALGLLAQGIKVSVVNPACIKGFAQSENIRNKNDSVDAGVIARYCAVMKPQLWQAPSLEVRQLRAWSDRLAALKEIRQQELNRIEVLELAGQQEVEAHVREHVQWLDKKIKQIESDIDDHIDRHPNLKHDADLLHSIPGLGRTTVAKLLGGLGDIRRFRDAKALAAFVGVTPKQRQSGSSVRGRTTISRMGSGDMRAALYMPAMVARKHNPILRCFAERLQANGMAPMAIIGAVARKLVHQIYGVIRSGKPFNPSYLQKSLAVQDGI
jgi:transposase